MANKDAWDNLDDDNFEEINRKLQKKAASEVKSAQPTETGITTRQRRTYTEENARDPFSLSGHEILGFNPLDYMQKNTTPTSVVLSQFAKLATYTRSKLDPNSPAMTQLASREMDEYLSVVGLSFLVDEFGYDKVLDRYSVEEIERVLAALNKIQQRINNSQSSLQRLLLSSAKRNN
ncbi:hypothetical protein [Photobacterium leiognathi]|uniref:hypothetical protein n=1 Tax=Photobacterium leiognathi TaxID=553611 RepID=UPI00273A105C|nr:hypothetical protein [Photobacterium leiognathi]